MIKIGNKTAVGGFIAALLIFAPTSGFAIGLGALKVHSALNEPLNAEIPFTSLSPRERKKLEASLANRLEFQAADIDRSPHLSSIKFSVAKRVDGRYFLQLRTEESFREPFIHLLIKIKWAGGRLIREYSALIDPPYLVAGRSTSVQTPVIQAVPVEPISQIEAIEPEPVKAVPAEISGVIEPLPVEQAKPEPAPEQPEAQIEAVPEPATVTELEPVEAQEPDTFGDEILGPGNLDTVAMDNSGWPIDPVDAAIEDDEADLQASLELIDEEPLVEPLEPIEPEEVLEPEKVESIEPVEEKAELIEPMFEPEPVSTPSFDVSTISDTYSVKRGDTMWGIAEQVKRDNSYQQLSVQQIVMAIYQKNRHAFFKPNVNNLKAGKIIDIPESANIDQSGHSSSLREFRVHYGAWQEYKLKLASAAITLKVDSEAAKPEPKAKEEKVAVKEKQVEKKPLSKAKEKAKEKAKAKPKEAKKPKVAEKPKETPKEKPKSKVKATSAEDLLRIVRANLKKDANKAKSPDTETSKDRTRREKKALVQRMAQTEESLESSKLQNKETGERVGQVNEQLAKQKRLIELENAKLAQTKAGSKKPETSKKPAAETKISKKPRVKPRPKARPKPPTPEKGFVDELMDTVTSLSSDSTSLKIIGGVVGVVVLLVVLTMRRRRQAKMEFEESILNSTMDSEVSDTGEQTTDEGDTSFLSDFSQTNMNNISTDEVDPIAEADVYLAYGRDEQAEEILREAIAKDAGRHEIHEKLLEIYHQREDTGAFETLAEELYAAMGGQGGELWVRVAAMGMKLNPSNPMFSGKGGPPASGAADTATMDQAATESLADTLEGAESLDFDSPGMDIADAEGQETMLMPSEDVGLDMTGDKGAETPKTPAEEPGGLDMGGLDIGGDSPAAEEADSGIAFNLDFDGGLGDGDSAEAEAPAETPADDGGGLDFDMEASALDMSSEETSTDEGDGALDMGDLSLEADSEDVGLEMESSVEEPDTSEDIAGELNLEDASGDDLQWDAESDANTVDSGESVLMENSTDLDMEGDSVLAMEDSALDDGDSVLAMEEPSEIGELDAGEEDSEQWDEAATKLDLAKAYIDMGDAEGAKSILDEVMEEGNADQKKQAEELATQVA